MRDLLMSVEPNFWMKISGVLFGMIFMAIIAWVFNPGMKRYFEDEGNLPIVDDDN